MTEACAEAIGAKNLDDALESLQKINIGFSDQGELQVETDAHGNITGVPPGQELALYFGGIFGIGKNIKLNNEVDWFDPNSTPALDQNGKQTTYPLLTAEAFQLGISSMNAGQFMDLTVLHELAHGFKRRHPDDDSAAFDQNIWSHCLK